MTRFLHVADVHLGYDHYNSPERSRDFFTAFRDALERYALGSQVDSPVDFVLIAGDLFEYRQVLPATLNQAEACLVMLRDAGIPVLAIEGNHDYRPYGTATSWLRYLSDWDLLYLLEPNDNEEFDPWQPEDKRGGYLDLACGVRVIGSRWYGASAPQAINQLAKGIARLPPGPTHTVMMFHHGLEGQVSRYSGALRYQDLLPLHQAGVDYLALGHIHRSYTEAGWIFNPGSIEANSISENQRQNPRGVFLVTLAPEASSETSLLTGKSKIQAELKTDYYQRPILRLQLTAHPRQTLAELEAAAIQLVKQQKQSQEAIVELRITGQVGFQRLDLDVRALQQTLQDLSGALIFLLKYEVFSTQFDTAIPAPEQTHNRAELESIVFTDQFAALGLYRHHASLFAKGLMDLKDKILDNCSEPELYGIVQHLSQYFDFDDRAEESA